MTEAELKGVAAQTLNLAKREIEKNEFNFLLATYHIGDTPPLHRMSKVEALIIQRMGEGWLNNEKAKYAAFGMLRVIVDVLPPDAFIFVTSANRFTSTEKLMALPKAQRDAILDAGHDRHHLAVKEGFLEIHDCLCAIAQTPDMVCQYMQDVENGVPVGTPTAVFTSQETFGGRMKMFGDKYELPG